MITLCRLGQSGVQVGRKTVAPNENVGFVSVARLFRIGSWGLIGGQKARSCTVNGGCRVCPPWSSHGRRTAIVTGSLPGKPCVRYAVAPAPAPNASTAAPARKIRTRLASTQRLNGSSTNRGCPRQRERQQNQAYGASPGRRTKQRVARKNEDGPVKDRADTRLALKALAALSVVMRGRSLLRPRSPGQRPSRAAKPPAREMA